jgi:hypothetical protein
VFCAAQNNRARFVTMAKIMIRTETEDDEPIVAAVVERTFGQVDEARLVSQLRTETRLSRSLPSWQVKLWGTSCSPKWWHHFVH